MGQFINEVAKINQNYNHKYKISEERDNVRNALYKRFYKEFKKRGEDYDDTYNYLANIRTKDTICMREYDFGTHVTWEFVDTTYYKELKKVYKIFKEHERTEKILEEQQEISKFYILFGENDKMDELKTYERHAKNNNVYDIITDNNHIINCYKIYDANNNPYLLKIYYFKENGLIDLLTTTRQLKKDGILQGVRIQRTITKKNILDFLLAIPLIAFLGYLGFHALIGIGIILFIVLIILCN